MKKQKKTKLQKRASETVHTPEPPQVMYPPSAPDRSKNQNAKKKKERTG